MKKVLGVLISVVAIGFSVHAEAQNEVVSDVLALQESVALDLEGQVLSHSNTIDVSAIKAKVSAYSAKISLLSNEAEKELAMQALGRISQAADLVVARYNA